MDLKLPPDFKDFLRLLRTHGVDYLLIGGYAVGYHGYPRTTNDLDIWIAIRQDNAEKTAAALREFGFDTPQVTAQLFLEEGRIVRMGEPPMRIEIATTISGVTFDECFARKVVDELDGVEVDLIHLRDLKVNKQASGRFKDLDDLEHLP
jgi:predicted nucleotidyltransferase